MAIRSWPRIVLELTGLGFVAFGLAYTLWPLPMAGLTEIPLPTPTARIDFAATYGGLQMGLGLFLIVCARRPRWIEPGLWAAVAALSGLVLVRFQSLVAVGGHMARPIGAGFAIELSAALANAVSLRWLRRGDRRDSESDA